MQYILAVTSLVLAVTLHAAEPDHRRAVPEAFSGKLQNLMKKYFPRVEFEDRKLNGIHFSYLMRDFVILSEDPSAKHENSVQRGPQKNGIACRVYMSSGKYFGQTALPVTTHDDVPMLTLDKKVFNQLLAAPYSAKNNVHLWVSLSYPDETSAEFLKEFKMLLNTFQKE